MYTPHVGRWLSKDPSGFVDGPNQYLYVKNGPTGAVDPSGLAGWPAAALGKGQCGNKINNDALGVLRLIFGCCHKKECLMTQFGENTIPKSRVLPKDATAPDGGLPGNGVMGNEHQFCGPLKAGTVVGTGGLDPSIGVVVHCLDGTTLVAHFNSNQDPWTTLLPYKFPANCVATVCGGDNSDDSNCTMTLAACVLRRKGVITKISDTTSCWVDSKGKFWAAQPSPNHFSNNKPPLNRSAPCPDVC